MAPEKPTTTSLGAGLSLSPAKIKNHPAGPPQHGQLTQAERAFTLASTFLSGVLAISASQFIGAPLKLIDPVFYEQYMAYTKESFAILITCLTQWWAPTVVRVSGDSSMQGQLFQGKDGSLRCNFADRMVMMANHQLYTDWLYLWWVAYTNNMHGHIYIILKESIKNIPIVGWGCQFYNFIFLSREWERDKSRLKNHLQPLKRREHPMWLLIFPEGTNLAADTRASSKRWAEKNGIQDMKHLLLPRNTGLKFCLEELKETTDWLYDCTIAYEGVPPGQFGQDIFTLRTSFLEGRPPKSVNMHWRRFRISSIPVDNPVAFDVWLRNRWREKDYMLEYFTRNGKFPADDYWKDELRLSEKSSETASSKSVKSIPRAAYTIETQVKSGSWNEFVKIFTPISAVMMALMLAYGASPDQLPFPNQKQFLEQQMKAFLMTHESSGAGPINLRNLEKVFIDEAPGFDMGRDANRNQVVQKLTEHHLRQLNLAHPMMPPNIQAVTKPFTIDTKPNNKPRKIKQDSLSKPVNISLKGAPKAATPRKIRPKKLTQKTEENQKKSKQASPKNVSVVKNSSGPRSMPADTKKLPLTSGPHSTLNGPKNKLNTAQKLNPSSRPPNIKAPVSGAGLVKSSSPQKPMQPTQTTQNMSQKKKNISISHNQPPKIARST